MTPCFFLCLHFSYSIDWAITLNRQHQRFTHISLCAQHWLSRAPTPWAPITILTICESINGSVPCFFLFLSTLTQSSDTLNTLVQGASHLSHFPSNTDYQEPWPRQPASLDYDPSLCHSLIDSSILHSSLEKTFVFLFNIWLIYVFSL